LSGGARSTVLIVSDPHFACGAERARGKYEIAGIINPSRVFSFAFGGTSSGCEIRLRITIYWTILERAGEPDLVVANGDYSCDSAFIGVSDPASRQSAAECLSKVRGKFGEKLLMTLGDHELGKNKPGRKSRRFAP